MIVSYNDDLTEQEFFESGETLTALGIKQDFEKDNICSLGKLSNPVVAFDGLALSQMPNGQLIKSLFGHPQIPTISEFQNVRNAWFSELNGTWPPSIDTMTHLVGQRESDAIASAETVLDVACGTGMAGYSAIDTGSTKKVSFSDINPNAVETVKYNAQFKTRPLATIGPFFARDGLGFDESEKYDLIIASAVPATPTHRGLRRSINSLFEGTNLLRHIVVDAPTHLTRGGKLIISHSSCGDGAFDEAVRDSNYVSHVKTLYERDNAFRTEFLTNVGDRGNKYVDQEWVKFLVDCGGLKAEPLGDYSYRHTVRVKEISFD